MIRIGTGGYNHREWIGSFYPVEMGPARYLARYAEDFNVCELQLSSYRMPQEDDAERILGESGERLFFTALAPARLVEAIRSAGAAELPSVGAGFLLGEGSPEIRGRDFASRERRASRLPNASAHRSGSDRLLERVRGALRPYARAGRFGGLVVPLPSSVAATEDTLAAIARVHDRLEGLPLLIEPRDASWADAQVLDFLRGVGLGFVLADGPGPEGPSFGPDRGGPRPLPARQLVTFVPLTAETAYVRFQGRDGIPGQRVRSGGRDEPLPPWPPRGDDRNASGSIKTQLLAAWERGGFHPSPSHRGSRGQPASGPHPAERTGERRHGRSHAEMEDRRRSGPGQIAGSSAPRRMGSPARAAIGFPSAPSSYFYSWEELVGWLPTLRALAARARDLYIIFDNPGRGSAFENARMLGRLMGPYSRKARPPEAEAR